MGDTKIIIGDDTVQTLLLQEKDSLILQDKLISLYPYDEEITDPFPVNCRKLQNVFGDTMLSRVWMNYALSKVALVENTDYVKRTFESNPFDTVIYLTVSAAQKLATAHNNKSLGMLVSTYLSWATEQQHRAAAEVSLSLTQENISAQQSPFDSIRHLDSEGNEYWSARELQELLGYSKWQRFEDAIDRAMVSCGNIIGAEQVTGAGKQFQTTVITVPRGNGAQPQEVKDWHLTRYACYLVAMNGDPRKPEIAAAQTYFMTDYHRLKEQEEKGVIVSAERDNSNTFNNNLSSPFDSIKHTENEQEIWYARELQKFLNYSRWDDFESAIKRAKTSIYNAGMQEHSWIEEYLKPITSGRGRVQEVTDYRLNRYACYVIAMNGDPHKPEIAAAQTYFAVKTRQAEIQQSVARIDPEFQALLNETMTSIKTFVEQQSNIRKDVDDLQDRITKLEEEKRHLSVVKEADSYDPVAANGDISVGDMAVILQERGFDTGRQRLFDWLVKNKMIRKLKKGYVPLKKFADLGLLSSEESEYETPAGITVPYTKLLVTPKGKQYILERFTILASAN